MPHDFQKGRPAAKIDLSRFYAVVCAALALVPLWILWLLGSTALENRALQRDFREHAVSALATVDRFDTTTRQLGRESVTHHQMVVRYNEGPREIVAPVRNLMEIAPADQPGWIGREVPILRLAGQPGSEIRAEDIGLLPSPSHILLWVPMPALMLGICVYLAMTLWRKGRRVP